MAVRTEAGLRVQRRTLSGPLIVPQRDVGHFAKDVIRRREGEVGHFAKDVIRRGEGEEFWVTELAKLTEMRVAGPVKSGSMRYCPSFLRRSVKLISSQSLGATVYVVITTMTTWIPKRRCLRDNNDNDDMDTKGRCLPHNNNSDDKHLYRLYPSLSQKRRRAGSSLTSVWNGRHAICSCRPIAYID